MTWRATNCLLDISEQSCNGHPQALCDGDDFVIHQVSFLVFDARDGAAINENAFSGQFAGQVFLGDVWSGLSAHISDLRPDQVSSRCFAGFLHPCARSAHDDR